MIISSSSNGRQFMFMMDILSDLNTYPASYLCCSKIHYNTKLIRAVLNLVLNPVIGYKSRAICSPVTSKYSEEI